MRNNQNLVPEMIRIISNLETNYPELYQFLDEDPITIPSKPYPEVTERTLKQYVEDLRELLKQHRKTHYKLDL
jgi:hypothetical protein